MNVYSILARNYGPFAILEEIRLGSLATIIGQNDAGKSYILKALQTFLDDKVKMQPRDIYDRAEEDEVIIEVAFKSFPEVIELEEGVPTTLKEEMLLDNDGVLRIRKIYPRYNLDKYTIILVTNDYKDDQFAGLSVLKEKDLNIRCTTIGIEVTKSGRSITNKSKRELLRDRASELGIPIGLRELPVSTKDDLWKRLVSFFPDFVLFESDTRLGVGETTFQSKFRPIVTAAAEDPDVAGTKDAFTQAIRKAIQVEVDKIYNYLKGHTNAFAALKARPDFSWEKAVSFEIMGKDHHEIEKSLEQRGSGMRRLLMVAFFQYLAQRNFEGESNFIFAVEEPENCLHPGHQRELTKSFRRLADEGCQIILTSHSPVFAGTSPIEDLALVVRTEGIARAIQYPNLDLSDIAEELGVEPSDQITGYNACIFVEGIADIFFLRTIAERFKETGYINADFNDKKIGFILCGGESLKHWVDLRAMSRLSRRFGVMVDSDRKGPKHNIPNRKLNWKEKCETDGGIFFILRKREIENYIHPEAIKRKGLNIVPYDDFSDMKKLFGENVYKLISYMTCEEILERDSYKEDSIIQHELKEIVDSLLALSDGE